MGRSKNQKIKWIDCWQFNFNNVRFLIQAAYNVLPSLLNLHLRKSWFSYPLYAGKESLKHILGSLGDGCYLWWYDQILKVIASAINSSKYQSKNRRIKIVREGSKSLQSYWLFFTPDWQMFTYVFKYMYEYLKYFYTFKNNIF